MSASPGTGPRATASAVSVKTLQPLPALDRTYALVARRIGRELRRAEQAIDVLRLDGALNDAKDELDDAIRAEMLRVTEAWARHGGRPLMQLTPDMRGPLEQLHDLGVDEGLLELARLGYTDPQPPERAFAAPDPDPAAGLAGVFDTMEQGLAGITVRIEDELVAADLADMTSQAIARALLRVPGARDLASRVVSSALTSGLQLTFEENSTLVACWEYTAILDGGTCEVCAPLDGSRYRSLAALFEVLPGFGPNPRCRGGGRCRCRAVPCPPDET